MQNYEYQEQFNEVSCGAACLSMIYKRHGIDFPQEQIYLDLNKYNVPLQVADIVNHVNDYSKLFACAVKFKGDVGVILRLVNDSKFDMIMNHIEKGSNTAHFTLFTKVVDDIVYGVDPYHKENFPVSISEMETLWQKNENADVGKIAGKAAILISDDESLFSTITRLCGHSIMRINFEKSVIDRILCSRCNDWRGPGWD